MAASEEERTRCKEKAKTRLVCRLKGRSHTTIPPTGPCGTGGGEGIVPVCAGSDQGEDGTNGVNRLLQPVTGVALKDDTHSTVLNTVLNGTHSDCSSSSSDNAVKDTDRQTPSLCIPQLLFELNTFDLKKDISKRLFVTHAQYKFAYKTACDFCRLK